MRYIDLPEYEGYPWWGGGGGGGGQFKAGFAKHPSPLDSHLNTANGTRG